MRALLAMRVKSLQYYAPALNAIVVCDSEEIRWGRLKMRDLMPKYNNGISGLIL